MATYIQGVTDYIPQIQEFKPDFNFYSKSLQMKQSKYDANHERLSNLYGSLLNSPMLRGKNIEERDAFFKVIDQDIKQMASLDLSKQQNIDAASSVFNQMLDNKSIVKDMVWTKNWQKEHQRADAFRNCVDPEKCGGAWWEGGVTALNYMAEEFKNVSDQDALNFGNARFTPSQDVMGKAIKLAKEADLSIKVDKLTGGWIVTTKNGPALTKPLQDLFMGSLGKDPKIMDYYKTKAFVARKGWVQSNVSIYGSPEAAQTAYSNNLIKDLQTRIGKAKQDAGYTQENVSQQRKALEERIKSEGTTSNSPLADAFRRMTDVENQVGQSVEVLNEADGNVSVANNNKESRAAMANLDRALGMIYLQGDIGKAAQTLAWKDFEQTRKVNPYAMESSKQANRLILENVKQKGRKEIAKYKFDLKQFAKMEALRGDIIANEGIPIDAGSDAVTANLSETAAYDQFIKQKKKQEQEISAPQRRQLINAMSHAQRESKNSNVNKAAVAKTDLLQMFDQAFKYMKADDPALIKRYESWDNEKKLKYLQEYDVATEFQKLPGSVADKLYDEVLLPMIDMSKNDNSVTRSYLSNLWTDQKNKNDRDQIQARSAMLEQTNAYYKRQVAKVKQDLQAGGYEDVQDALIMYIDENGNEKEREEFAKDYMAQVVRTSPDTEDKKGIAQNAYEEALEMYDNMDDDENLMHQWKKAYSKFAEAEGQMGLLSGGGSMAVAKARYHPTVDPYEIMSGGTQGTHQYLADIFKAPMDQRRVTFSGSNQKDNPEAYQLLLQLQSDFRTRNKSTDGKRPILGVTVSNIAGGDENWMKMNIKLDEDYVQQHIGTKKKKGVFHDYKPQLTEAGIDLFLHKDAASNQFYLDFKSTPLETILHYNGEYKIDTHPEHYEGKLRKITGESGQAAYEINGVIKLGLDEKGEPIERADVMQFYEDNTSPDEILRNYMNEIVKIVEGVKYDEAAYNLTHGIKNTNEL